MTVQLQSHIVVFMETIFVIVLILLFIVYLYAQTSKKSTRKERYGEAVSHLVHDTADSISGIAYAVTEPASKKKVRLAREELAMRNGRIYRYDHYSDRNYLEHLMTIDAKFQNVLNTIYLSKEKWLIIAKKLFYIGAIRVMSREDSDYSKKNQEYSRRHIVTDWVNDEILKGYTHTLLEALGYFNISVEEWVKNGDSVIEMYNITDDKDLREYGDIVAIMPMKNNRHLL